MSRFAFVFALCAAVVIGGCANVSRPVTRPNQPDGQPVFITLQVQQHLNKYYEQIGGGRPGAFAVSDKGTVGFYAYCQAVSCRDDVSFPSAALRGCEARGLGKCVLLAVGRSVQRPYMTYQEAEEKGLLKKTAP